MSKTVEAFKVVALASASALFLAGASLLVESTILEHRGATALAGTAVKLNSDLDSLHTEFEEIHSLTNDARYSIAEVNRNVLDERKMYESTFPDLIGRVDAVLGNVDAVLGNVQTATGDLHPLLTEATARIHDLKPAEDNAALLIGNGNKLFADPRILTAIGNLNLTTAALADSAKQADGILTDGKQEADKLVHPSKKKLTFWGAVLATGQTIQKLSPPLF